MNISPLHQRAAVVCYIRKRTFFAILLGSIALTCGCTPDLPKAPSGRGVVREHVIADAKNVPPIDSKLDYTLLHIDGAPIVRETPPPLVDMHAGAVVLPGPHRFVALVAPHLRPAGYVPQEISFTGTVEAGKIYFLVDEKGLPVLIEKRSVR